MASDSLTQLSFFDNPDNREHPLLVAEKWSFPLQHYERRETEGGNLYSIQDWIAGIGSSTKRQAGKTWDNLKRELSKLDGQLEWTVHFKHTVEVLPYTSSNNRVYQLEFTTQGGLYRIAQEMRVTKDRPQLEEIKRYLANAGVLFDAVRRETEGGNLFIEARHKGIEHRKELTSTAQETHIEGKPDYAAITNTTYKGLFGASKAELVQALSLTPAQAAKFRDNLSELGIKAIDAAETISRLKMEQMKRKLTSIEQVEIVERATNIVAPGYLEAADWLGVDLASGRPLIN